MTNGIVKPLLTDIHPVLTEVTKFATFEDNLSLRSAWGKLAFAQDPVPNDREKWNYCLQISYQKEKKEIKEFLESFIELKFYRHIDKGFCCVAHCNESRTLLINMTSLFQDESRKISRFYRTIYCSAHYKENSHLY